MPHKLGNNRISYTRQLYPVLPVGEASVNAAEIVRFGGFPFCRTTAGEWVLVDGASAVDTED